MTQNPPSGNIKLSPVTEALLTSLRDVRQRETPDDYTKLNVSRAVSFLALIYEKVRNAVEYRESHLLRRAAIERILRRRLALNPSGKNEAEQIVRELLWARYFPKNSLANDDVEAVQHLLTRYHKIREYLVKGKREETRRAITTFLFELLSCEIEETLAPADAGRERLYTYFLFQTLRDRVSLGDTTEEKKDIYLFIALEKAYRKSDRAYLRYHLYELFSEPVGQHTDSELAELLPGMEAMFRRIDGAIRSPVVEKMVRYGKRQLPPYLILFDILNGHRSDLSGVLYDSTRLWSEMEDRCKEQYARLQKQVQDMTTRSIIYILVMKLIVAILVEYPLSLIITGSGNVLPIVLNTVFPPLFVALIVMTYRMPDTENTRHIYDRIVQIICFDPEKEKRTALVHRHSSRVNPVLNAAFTTLYVFAFGLVLYAIHMALSSLSFSLISQGVFIFFLCIAAFFSYRIKQQITEIMVVDRESLMRPLFDFFVIPLVAAGKLFDETVSRFNFLTVIFDFIIEAPFKLIIDVIEEWISFIRAKREDVL